MAEIAVATPMSYSNKFKAYDVLTSIFKAKGDWNKYAETLMATI